MAILTGIHIEKDSSRTNWEKNKLSHKQILYAGIKIFINVTLIRMND